VGAARSDVWNSLWSYWWLADALERGELPLRTGLLNHPLGGRILVADPVNGLLATALVWRAGPAVAHNLLVMVHLLAAGLAAHALARSLGGRGWVAGVGFAFSPLLLSHAHNGASEAVAACWLPLSGLAVVWALRRGGLLRSLAAGGALFVAAAASWYCGVAAWILLLALVLLWRGQPRGLGTRARRLLPAALVGLALSLPMASATRAVAQAPDGLVVIKNTEDLARLRRTLGPADPRVFFVPGSFRSPDFPHLEGNPSDYGHIAYLGWVLLSLAIFAPLLRRRAGRGPPREEGGPGPALWAALLAGLLLALGPVLVIGGYPLALAGRALPLPYQLLEGLPGFDALSLLYRLSLVSALCLALLADRALTRVVAPRWSALAAGLVAALALCETCLLSPASGMPAVTTIPSSSALEALSQAPRGAVINVPVAGNRAYLFEQTLHRMPIAAGLNTGANRAALEVLTALRRLRTDKVQRDEVLEVARGHGIRYLVLHRDEFVADAFLPATGALRKQWQPLAEDGRVQVYQLY